MLELCTLASGSSGNSLLVTDGRTHVLVDAGISCRRITQALASLDLTLEDIDAILITHEHVDHVRALGTLQKKCAVPLYASRGTAAALDYPAERVHAFTPGDARCARCPSAPRTMRARAWATASRATTARSPC